MFLQWIYEAIYGAISDLFTMMGNMGSSLFDLPWVRGYLKLFSLFGWALLLAGLFGSHMAATNDEEIQNQWRIITKEKKVDIVVIDMPLLDTRRDKNLLGTFISDIVLQLLSFVAENERVNIRQRQNEGIAAAVNRGVTGSSPVWGVKRPLKKFKGLFLVLSNISYFRRLREYSMENK